MLDINADSAQLALRFTFIYINQTLNIRAWEALIRSLILVEGASPLRGFAPEHRTSERSEEVGSSSPFRGGGVASERSERVRCSGANPRTPHKKKCGGGSSVARRSNTMSEGPAGRSPDRAFTHFASQRSEAGRPKRFAIKLPAYWLANSVLAAERSEVKRTLFDEQNGGNSKAKYAQNEHSKGGGL